MKLFGISNCDTVKRARAWLLERGIDAAFHDYKRNGVPAGRLAAWQDAVGWERLLNRSGTTWRRLPDVERSAVTDAASAQRVMLAQQSVIKRPLVEWDEGQISVGFDANDWARRLAAS